MQEIIIWSGHNYAQIMTAQLPQSENLRALDWTTKTKLI